MPPYSIVIGGKFALSLICRFESLIILVNSTIRGGAAMTWSEARKLYPDQFVKVKIVKEHMEDDYECIDEVDVLCPVKEDAAILELIMCTKGTMVYHTSNKAFKMKKKKK